MTDSLKISRLFNGLQATNKTGEKFESLPDRQPVAIIRLLAAGPAPAYLRCEPLKRSILWAGAY